MFSREASDVESIPLGLRKALQTSSVIPFIGAGVSMAARGVDGKPLFPSWPKLLDSAADRLVAESREDDAALVRALLRISPPKYLEAAKHAHDALGVHWADFLKEIFDPPSSRVDTASLDLARAVWGLGSDLLITTNYDRVLQWSCSEPQKSDLRVVAIQEPHTLAKVLRGGIQRPTVWHLHGHIDQPTELILTPDGYEHLYSRDTLEARYAAALLTLKTIMASKTLLFVGFSLDDSYFMDQLRWITNTFKGAGSPHYVLLHKAEAERRGNKLEGTSVQVVPFADFGEPLVSLHVVLTAPATRGIQPLGTPVRRGTSRGHGWRCSIRATQTCVV